MNQSEDGEFDNVLHMPPRPIVPQPPKELVQITDIKLSPALNSKLESLRSHMMVCNTPDCPTCTERKRRFDMVIEQIKAEMVSFYDLKNKINEQADVDMALKSYIDLHEYQGRAIEVVEQYKQSHIMRIK
jgi:hypothetical protein